MNDSTNSAADIGAPGLGGPFPIVGIGASAGGLEAFRQLLGALPQDAGMAYVLVQHLDPHHESILAELLSEATTMHVSEVKSDVRVEPNHVYVIPPSKGLILVEGVLKLVPRGPPGSAHMPIDSFLKTLASVQGGQAIGVVLSGMGSDGTLGLQAIKGEGGIALAQEPTSAKYDDMPRSAISSGCVDFVLSPEAIAGELVRLRQHSYLAAKLDAVVPPGVRHPGDDALEDESLATVLTLMREATNTDFSGYKKTTLRRRIARRMAVIHMESVREYAAYLNSNRAETMALYEDCLISVTSFFRDPEVFQALSEQVLPSLLNNRAPDMRLRVWVAGCATGEEVYSLAICLLEHIGGRSLNISFQIFATDLSERALAKAREGLYLANIARDVSPERLRRFFSQVGDRYQISRSIREMCVFARHDLTRDPPYSRLDLVSCRNVLIYLEPGLQERVFATFHYALNVGGFLLVGPAETAGSSGALFAASDERRRIYSRKMANGPPRLLSLTGDTNPARPGFVSTAPKHSGASEAPREVDRILLARFGPAGVVVDENLRVLEFRGDTDPFLDHSHGKASLNLEHLLRKGLLMELRHAIAEARSTDRTVRRSGLQVRYRQELQSVAVEVVPIKGRAQAERCLLVVFEIQSAPTQAATAVAASPTLESDAKDREVDRLTQGLSQTTEYMHTLVREHESALEELQSTTEEALSSNEELQSLNEEMQTAKEEIQSANEELATLNQELQDRNLQLASFNDDMQRGLDRANALVDTMPGPLVILDSELRIEKTNAAFYEKFRTSAEVTSGRRLSELGTGEWAEPPLLAALSRVLSTGTGVEHWPIEKEFPSIGLRTMSLNARRLNSELGSPARLLLAIEDRTELKEAELGRERLLALEHEARKRAEAADQIKDQFVATASHELRGPLAVISGWMNILLRGAGTPDPVMQAKALAAIGRGVTAQGRLISDLLDYSRLVSGKVELQRTPIDLVLVAEAALVGVLAAAQAKDIDIQLVRDHVSRVVLGDFDRMQQVLWNLFLNAVKFTPRGGSVRISIARVANQVHVVVVDSGCGISKEFLPLVFERFRQAEGSSTRSHSGLGLGLTLVHELVELHGGTVYAESEGPGRGATFTVVLPIPAVLLVPPEQEASLAMLPQAKPESVRRQPIVLLSSHTLDGTKVLVVDDEADARDALVGLLERYGAHVFSAASVAEAMVALATDLPDVLISDLSMPGADGYELIRRVRLLPPDAGGHIPSVAVSGYATDEHRKKVMRTGFQSYLEKPVVADELITQVALLAGLLTIPAVS